MLDYFIIALGSLGGIDWMIYPLLCARVGAARGILGWSSTDAHSTGGLPNPTDNVWLCGASQGAIEQTISATAGKL